MTSLLQPAAPALLGAPGAAPVRAGRWRSVLLGVGFLAVAAGIALIRLRTSPLYPTHNDVNSDVFVYQLVGNSWRHSQLPYRDVYDVKGPFLYLLFGLSARLRPWSMGPPLVLLTLLAFASVWLAYAIARLSVRRRWLAAVSAVVSCVLIYLSVAQVSSSFTREEVAVPGVLLLLWLVSRELGGRGRVPDGWWLLDGVVVGALFWTKYLVLGPWLAMLVALTAVVVRRQLPARRLRRVVVLHGVGAIAGTAVILPFFARVLPEMVGAYFLAKRGTLDLSAELPKQVAFALTSLTQNSSAALLLLGVGAVLLVRVVRRADPERLALAVVFGLTVWASAALVRHPNNLFVPLTFCAVALPALLAAAESRGRRLAGIAVGTAVLAAAACLAPLTQAVTSYGLLRPPRPLTCYDLTTGTRSTPHTGVSTAFAGAAGNAPILSLGTLFAARTSYISQRPLSRPFEFVDGSWAGTVGADRVQTGYLRDRTFDYVWIHVPGLDPLGDVAAQIGAAARTGGRTQREQMAALAVSDRPVLACNHEILLRGRTTPAGG